MPLSSFAPLAGLVQGLDAWTKYQTDQQALDTAQQQQQILQGLWPALQNYQAMPQQTPLPPTPLPSQLTSPQQPQAPAATGAPGAPPPAPFQLAQLPNLSMPSDQSLGFAGGQGIPPSGFALPQQQFTPPAGMLPTGMGFGGFGQPQQQAPADLGGGMLSGLPPPQQGPAFAGGQAAMPSPFALTQQPTFGGGGAPDTYAPDPLTGAPVQQASFQPGQQQQLQAPGPVGDPSPPQPQQPQAGGGAAGLFQSTIVPLESGGNMNIAPGSYGEIGPAQMLPETFRQYAQPGENINNPQDNLRVGLRYADDLWQKSGGDRAAVLVGYNRGEGAMRTFQASGDDPRSVRVAPEYQQAVARELQGRGQQAYAESSAHIDASTSPQEKAHADAGARNILSQMQPNPLAYAGRVEIPQLVQAIERGNPNASDAVKSGIFMKLYPMLSQADQQQYTRLWDQYKFGAGQEEKKEEFDIRQQELRETHAATEAYRAATLGGKGWSIERLPDGTPVRVNAGTGEVAPLNLPAGTTRMGTGGAGGAGATTHTFMIPGQNEPVTVRLGKNPGEAWDLSGNPVKLPPNARPMTAAQAGGNMVTRSQAEWVATYVEKTGTWPTTSGRNLALTNQVEQILAERGVDPEKVAEAMGTFGATKSSLTAATKLRDAVHGYEGTALRNLDQATKEMHRTAPTNFGPWLNNWMLTGSMQMGGTGPPAEIAAVLTFANEYAKVMSGATGAAAATEGARREAAELFSPYFSAGQWDEAARIAKTDMGNRMAELDDNVDVITSRLGRGAPEKSARPSGEGDTGGGQNLDATPEQYEKLPSGAAYTVPGDSTVRYKP